MAAPKKDNLTYFSFDTNFFNDDKIQYLDAQIPWIGPYLFIRLLCKIYDNGYYLNWDDRAIKMLARQSAVDHTVIINAVNVSINEKLFDSEMLNSQKILTSRAIQERFVMGVARRSGVNMIKEFLLINPNDQSQFKRQESFGRIKLIDLKSITATFIPTLDTPLLEQPATLTPVNAALTTQSKVKEIKEKEIKEKNTPLLHPPVNQNGSERGEENAERREEFKILLNQYLRMMEAKGKIISSWRGLRDLWLERYEKDPEETFTDLKREVDKMNGIRPKTSRVAIYVGTGEELILTSTFIDTLQIKKLLDKKDQCTGVQMINNQTHWCKTTDLEREGVFERLEVLN